MDDSNLDIIDFTNKIYQRLNTKKISNNNNFSDLDNFPLISGKQCLYIMDWHQSKITYSRGVEQMLGYNKGEFTKEVILYYFHPDDANFVKRIIQVIVNHVIKTDVSSHDMFLNITFRLIKKDKSYLKVLRQTKTYDHDDNGMLISNISLLTDISFMNDNKKVEWDINYGNIDPVDFKESIFQEFQNFFTNREIDVIRLISNNHKTKEIAKILFISEHTVYSHRKNILKKSKCHNSKELLDFCHKIWCFIKN